MEVCADSGAACCQLVTCLTLSMSGRAPVIMLCCHCLALSSQLNAGNSVYLALFDGVVNAC